VIKIYTQSIDKHDKSRLRETQDDMSVNKFISSSVLLFLDNLIYAAGNWIYWLIISKIISTSELGQATTILSLVTLAATLTQLGLEYPILKRSPIQPSQILAGGLVIELVLTFAALPLVIYLINNIYEESLQSFGWVAVGMLILLSLDFVSRFVLLGISHTRNILVIDALSIVIKFVVGYTLVTMGFGAFGLLSSFLLQALFIAVVSLLLEYRIFGFKVPQMEYIKVMLKEGMVNIPSKLSRTLIFSLSIVLLASFGIASSEIGIFYIALMISTVGGGLVASMAFMAIPASALSKKDLSSGSMRIGISLTAPVVAALIVSPKFILSVIGTQYMSAETILLALSIAILPFSIVQNAISKFNYLGNSRKLLLIGSAEVGTFLVTFIFLVPHYSTLGAAISILIAFSVSSIVSMLNWSERSSAMRYIANSGMAVLVGWGLGYAVHLLLDGNGVIVSNFTAILSSVGATLVIIVALKNTSTTEIRHMLRIMVSRGQTTT
jgi:O-antigen/teichoic acid export membrane protein